MTEQNNQTKQGINLNQKPVKFKINTLDVEGYPGEKIIDVAKRYGITIPHLCMHPRLERIGACRLCIVDIEGMAKPVTSCNTDIREGMIVKTHTPRILQDRRTIMKLILANHDYNCVTCSQNLGCKLQDYAEEMTILENEYKGEVRQSVPDFSSTSIVRDNKRCILCRRCVRICNDVQSVYAIGVQNRGFYSEINTPFKVPMAESSCVNCGQCVVVCPTGALDEKSGLNDAISALNSGKHVVAQIAPSIRATLGECFGLEPGTPVTGKIVTALKEIGFAKVFDTDFAADITIIEEATELIKRIKENRDLPMITTCCPAWIKFGEQFFFEELHHMSTCRSPQSMMASMIKTYYANKEGLNPENIIVIDVMPCTAKKFEIERPEFKGETNIVLTTTELGKLIKMYDIDFLSLKDTEFDNPLGASSGAGDIFGRSGGVMEAALRTAADLLSGESLQNIEYHKIRGMETLKEAEITIAGNTLKIAVVHTLGEARKIMNMIRQGDCPYHFIEIMACYGGCVGGGGQPRYDDSEILEMRASALNKEDSRKSIRKSHLNPAVLALYKEYIGEPGGETAHRLLHTWYRKREHL
ncbi:MAG: NADH-dependent [FeFe] hydrogenase, group A6 [Candidatus Nanoarchaeia archaeon]